MRPRCFLLLVLSIFYLGTYAQEFEWAKRFSAVDGVGTSYGYLIDTDANGNVYTYGRSRGKVDFDPSSDTFFLEKYGINFLSKLDSSGNFIWAKSFASKSAIILSGVLINDMSVDQDGNIYLAGEITGTVYLDTISLASTNNASPDILICKLDSSANLLWARIFGNDWIYDRSILEEALSITVDNRGNVYTTGIFGPPLDFDPGQDTFLLSGDSLSVDTYVNKLDKDGNFVWARTIGQKTNLSTQYAIAVAVDIEVDQEGNVYTVGTFDDVIDFDPDTLAIQYSKGEQDCFIKKIDKDGNFIWVKTIGGAKNDHVREIELDKNGNIYILGKYRGAVDFDLSSDTFNLYGEGDFIAKYNDKGDFIWVRKLKNFNPNSGRYYGSHGRWSGDSRFQTMSLDSYGNSYTFGSFTDTLDFSTQKDTQIIKSTLGPDLFYRKLSSSGEIRWVGTCGGTFSVSRGLGITVDDFGNILTTGLFNRTADFDPGEEIYYLKSDTGLQGRRTAFIQKLSACKPIFLAKAFYICRGDSVIIGGEVYKKEGTFIDTLVNSNGCDSIITTDIIHTPLKVSSQEHHVCEGDSIVISGQVIKRKGISRVDLKTPEGCDSTVYVRLTIDEHDDITQNVSICLGDSIQVGSKSYFTSGTYVDSFKNVIGCDSIITTNLAVDLMDTSIQNIELCAGDSLIIGANVYTKSGLYYDSLTSKYGCDSLIKTDLFIVDLGVTIKDNRVKSNQDNATYQWLDCNNNKSAIVGETKPNITLLPSTKYAVEVRYKDCIDTSACFGYTPIVGNDLFSVYPNPTRGPYFIKTSSTGILTMFDSNGKLISREQVDIGIIERNAEFLSSGTYSFKFENSNDTKTVKLVVSD